MIYFIVTELISSSQHCTKKKFSIKNLLSKSDQIRMKLRTWSHVLKKSLIENFYLCAVQSGFKLNMILSVDHKIHKSIYISCLLFVMPYVFI